MHGCHRPHRPEDVMARANRSDKSRQVFRRLCPKLDCVMSDIINTLACQP